MVSAGVMTGMMRVQYSCSVQSSAMRRTRGRTNGIILWLRNSPLSAGRTRWWTIRWRGRKITTSYLKFEKASLTYPTLYKSYMYMYAFVNAMIVHYSHTCTCTCMDIHCCSVNNPDGSYGHVLHAVRVHEPLWWVGRVPMGQKSFLTYQS